MGDEKKIKKLNTEIEALNVDIENLKRLCKELNGDDDEICAPALRKKAASGQHGLKDNATRGQIRKGLEKRIDFLKSDAKKAIEVAALL